MINNDEIFANGVALIYQNDYDGFLELVDNHPTALIQTDDYHRNLFHYACAFQREEIISLLLKDGLDPNKKNSEKQSPFEVYLRACPEFSMEDGSFNPNKIPTINEFVAYGAYVSTMTLNNFDGQQSQNKAFKKDHKIILKILEDVWSDQSLASWRKPKRPNPRPPKFRL
ncbi:MAG: hypothetical protein CMP22_08085 [Rickettsiales bacterium]|nr:hypothetical protein [Rickettsiales bacterium]